MPKLFRPRLLPVMIFVAVLMLSVRIGAVWTGMEEMRALRVGQSAALAQANPAPGAAPGAGETAAEGAAETATGTPPADGAMPAGPTDAGAGAPGAAAPPEIGFDPYLDNPAAFTQSEIDLLQRLSERREQLDAKARELDQREALLRAAEGRIDRKIAEMKTLEESIQGLLTEHTAEERARLDRLVNIYKAMKPKDAAQIFNDMDLPLVVDIFMIMTERSSAAILAVMDPQKARAITNELAQRRSLPEPGSPAEG